MTNSLPDRRIDVHPADPHVGTGNAGAEPNPRLTRCDMTLGWWCDFDVVWSWRLRSCSPRHVVPLQRTATATDRGQGSRKAAGVATKRRPAGKPARRRVTAARVDVPGDPAAGIRRAAPTRGVLLPREGAVQARRVNTARARRVSRGQAWAVLTSAASCSGFST